MVEKSPSRTVACLIGVLLGALIVRVYRAALSSQFFNDDFHWLSDARRFAWLDLVRLERYDHFYRPVVSVYFYLGQRLFGCDPRPFHALSLGIHVVNTLLLAAFTRALTGSQWLAALAALLFAVQPGYVEAVAWVGAITDLLPATWFLLALWLHLRFLQTGAPWPWAGALGAFGLCLGTHETVVTILPMLLALDVLVSEPRLDEAAAWLRQRVPRYLPYVVLLLGYLAITYIVNSRSYLVRDGHYQFGWHAIGNIFDYLAGLYVGRRRPLWHAAVAVAMAAIAWRGTPRQRLYLLWMLVTLVPVSFFTWGTASRYLYVPAAGFALLLAEGIVFAATRASRWLAPRTVQVATALLVVVLVVRFAAFAGGGVRDFHERAEPYARLTAAVRNASASINAAGEVRVRAADVANVPLTYRDPAAETALCRAGVRLAVE